MPNVCNWWCKIGPVDYDDIDTIHEILAYTKKNKTFDPTLSSYVPNTQKGIKYAITGVYLGSDEENQQVPYMKVSFLLIKLHQFVQFFLIFFFFFQLFIQFNERKRDEQVLSLLDFQFETLETPKELGATKGITENPILKIELTKTNAYKVTTFGEFQDVKRKGRTPIAAKSKTESPKKKVANLKHEDEDEEESEESDAINNEDEIEEDKERDKKKAKSEKSALKDYLGEKSFKSSPGKSEKYHSQIKAAQQILTRKSTPLKASPEETKKETVENKLKLDFSDKKMADMEEKITNTVTEKVTETVKDLLTQFLQQQQPKQEINNKGDIENKHDGKDM